MVDSISSQPPPSELNAINVTLGGGGSRGAYIIGFLDFIQEYRVNIASFLGVSAGSLVACFYTNGYSPEFIATCFSEEFQKMPIGIFMQAFSLPLNPFKLFYGGMLDFEPFMRHLVEKYGLKPNKKLKILAYDILKRKPIVFEGDNYDLPKALAASCSIPGLMRPVEYVDSRGCLSLLVDGGAYHLNPAALDDNKPNIIVRLFAASYVNAFYPNRQGDFITYVGDSEVSPFATLNASLVQRMRMVGYKASLRDLLDLVKCGQIPTLTQA